MGIYGKLWPKPATHTMTRVSGPRGVSAIKCADRLVHSLTYDILRIFSLNILNEQENESVCLLSSWIGHRTRRRSSVVYLNRKQRKSELLSRNSNVDERGETSLSGSIQIQICHVLSLLLFLMKRRSCEIGNAIPKTRLEIIIQNLFWKVKCNSVVHRFFSLVFW